MPASWEVFSFCELTFFFDFPYTGNFIHLPELLLIAKPCLTIKLQIINDPDRKHNCDSPTELILTFIIRAPEHRTYA